MMKEDQNKYIDSSGHLNRNGISLCAEYMLADDGPEGELISRLNDHLEHCETCRIEVIELYELICNEPVIYEKVRVKKWPKGLHTHKTRASSANTFFRLAIAAGLLTLIVIGTYYLLSPIGNDDLFEDYFEPYQNLITIKSDNNNQLGEAMLYYDVQDYDSAAFMLEEYLTTHPASNKARFYLANAYLADDDAGKAIAQLEKVLENKGNTLQWPAKWYLALAQLKNGEENDARNTLREIVRENPHYRTKARKILDELSQ